MIRGEPAKVIAAKFPAVRVAIGLEVLQKHEIELSRLRDYVWIPTKPRPTLWSGHAKWKVCAIVQRHMGSAHDMTSSSLSGLGAIWHQPGPHNREAGGAIFGCR
jgi:hypothetical protein